jgi:hypothetical protein
MKTSKQVLAVSTSTHQENACPMALLKMSIDRIQLSMGGKLHFVLAKRKPSSFRSTAGTAARLTPHDEGPGPES